MVIIKLTLSNIKVFKIHTNKCDNTHMALKPDKPEIY